MQTVRHDLITTPLKCKVCGLCQQWMLPANERIRDVLKAVACFGCSAEGQLFLSTAQMHHPAANP